MRTNSLLKKYPNISISDIRDAEKYADQTLKELQSDISAFQKNMIQNWKREATAREMEIMGAKGGKGLIVEMFISARSSCIDRLNGTPRRQHTHTAHSPSP